MDQSSLRREPARKEARWMLFAGPARMSQRTLLRDLGVEEMSMRRGKWLFGCVVAGMAGVSMAAGCGDDTVANVPMDSGAPDQTTADQSSVDTGVEAAA